MKEFIFTWSIENISYSWHKKGEGIQSPSFVADTLFNTVWSLRLYPRGSHFDDWLGLILDRGEDGGLGELLFDCEFSFVSGNNLKLPPHFHYQINAKSERGHVIWNPRFFRRHEIFVRRKALYLPKDILTLRCRMWTLGGDIDEFGQCFGCTRLDMERILSVEDMNPRTSKKKTVLIHSNVRNKVLMSVNIFQEEDGLTIEIFPVNAEQIKFSTFEFSAVGRKRKPCKFISLWLDQPYREVWKLPFSNTESKASVRNKLKVTCKFIYSTGEVKTSIETVTPCSFKFSEFSSYNIISCIPSGKLSDCPNICKDLWNLYVKQILCDVEIKTRTSSFWVHKIVLCARSPVFFAMFNYDMMEKTSKCIKIEDLEDNSLEKFLTFLYTDGFEEIQWETALDLYYSADKYQVERLKILCSYYFMSKIDVSNVRDLLMLSDRHSDSILKSEVEDYIVRHHKEIFRSPKWKRFSENQPKIAVKTMLCKYDEARERRNPTKEGILFCPKIMDDFRSFQTNQNQIFNDIVSQASSTTFPAHETVLCAGSSSTRKLLADENSIDSLKMRDLEGDTAARLLLFLYTDSLGDIVWETATKLYHAAVSYQIERLKIQCSCFFLEKLQVSNAENLLQLAHEHQDARLESLVEDFISLNDADIIVSEDRKKLGKTDLPKRIETRRSKRLKLEKNN